MGYVVFGVMSSLQHRHRVLESFNKILKCLFFFLVCVPRFHANADIFNLYTFKCANSRLMRPAAMSLLEFRGGERKSLCPLYSTSVNSCGDIRAGPPF